MYQLLGYYPREKATIMADIDEFPYKCKITGNKGILEEYFPSKKLISKSDNFAKGGIDAYFGIHCALMTECERVLQFPNPDFTFIMSDYIKQYTIFVNRNACPNQIKIQSIKGYLICEMDSYNIIKQECPDNIVTDFIDILKKEKEIINLDITKSDDYEEDYEPEPIKDDEDLFIWISAKPNCINVGDTYSYITLNKDTGVLVSEDVEVPEDTIFLLNYYKTIKDDVNKIFN